MRNCNEKIIRMQLLINEVAKIKPPSPKRFGGFLLPIFQESNFRNKQSVVQYLRSYQWVSWIIEKEQNTNHTKVSQTCISKNKSNLFLWQGQSAALCLFLQVR